MHVESNGLAGDDPGSGRDEKRKASVGRRTVPREQELSVYTTPIDWAAVGRDTRGGVRGTGLRIGLVVGRGVWRCDGTSLMGRKGDGFGDGKWRCHNSQKATPDYDRLGTLDPFTFFFRWPGSFCGSAGNWLGKGLPLGSLSGSSALSLDAKRENRANAQGPRSGQACNFRQGTGRMRDSQKAGRAE